MLWEKMDYLEQANVLFSSDLTEVKRVFYMTNRENDINIYILGIIHDIVPGEVLDVWTHDAFDHRLYSAMLTCPRIRFDINLVMRFSEFDNIVNIINSGRTVIRDPFILYDTSVNIMKRLAEMYGDNVFKINSITTVVDEHRFDHIYYFLTSNFNDCSDNSIVVDKIHLPNDEVKIQQIWRWLDHITKIYVYLKYGWSWSHPNNDIPDESYDVDNENELLRGIELNLSMDVKFHLALLSSATIDKLADDNADINLNYEFYEPLDIIIMAYVSNKRNALQLDNVIDVEQVTKPSVYLNIQLYKNEILNEWKYGTRDIEESRPCLLKFIRDYTPNLLPLLEPKLTDEEYNSLTTREKDRFGIRGNMSNMSMFKF